MSAEERGRSPWRVLLPALLLAVVVVAAIITRVTYGGPGPAAIVFSGGVGLIALWAVWDGIRRAFGRRTYLGTGHGLDRLFGIAQVVLSIGMAVALLPNTLRLVEFLASAALPH